MAVRTKRKTVRKTRQIYRAALLCGLAAVLIHNLIDFAIFEPGIMTALWACIAIIYSDCHEENATDRNLNPNKTIKFILTVLAAALTSSYHLALHNTGSKNGN